MNKMKINEEKNFKISFFRVLTERLENSFPYLGDCAWLG